MRPVLVLAMVLACRPGSASTVRTVRGAGGAAIEAALAASAPGDTVRLPRGVITLHRALALRSGVTLAGCGMGGTVLRYAGSGPARMVDLSGCDAAALRDLTLDAERSGAITAGVFARDARRLEIRRVEIVGMARSAAAPSPHGIHFTGDAPSADHGVCDSEVAGCVLRDIGRGAEFGCGIRMSWGSSRNRITGCRIAGTGRGGIFGDNRSCDLVIRGNRVTGSGGERLGIEVWGGCDGCVIEDNRIDHWLSIGGCDRCAARRNRIACADGDYGSYGIEAIGTWLLVSGNTVEGGQAIGLSVSASQPKRWHVYVDNTFRRCSQWGAQLQGEEGELAMVYLDRCRFTGTTAGRGMVQYPGYEGHGFRTNGHVRGLTAERCAFDGNARYGLQLGGAGVDALLFDRCRITTNGSAAVAGPGAYEAGSADPSATIEWRNCRASGNRGDTLPTGRAFQGAPPTTSIRMAGRVRAGEPVECASGSRAEGGVAGAMWDFGDGPPQPGERAAHVYPRPGSYRVTLVVWDRQGRAVRASRTLSVEPGE